MKITVNIEPEEATQEGFAVVNVDQTGGPRLGQLDVEFSKLAPLGDPNPRALDFLLFAATAYALDKLVAREAAPDCWTRDFVVSIPVSDPKIWTAAKEELASSISFLTGDRWSVEFTELTTPLIRPRRRRYYRKITPLSGDAVCLFSGGLDSLIGTIDRLELHTQEKILLVGHHDGQIAGPLSDQHAGSLKRPPRMLSESEASVVVADASCEAARSCVAGQATCARAGRVRGCVRRSE